jgi:hypothetical protein
MGDTKDPVVFILGEGGEEASNDPRWLAEKMKQQIKAQESSTDNLAGSPIADEVAGMDQKALKEKAKELEVDVKGVKKVGELRARVAAAMAAQAAGDNDEDVDDDDEE